MEVGDVRVADDKDFEKFRNLCTIHDGWSLDYNKRGINVWTKKNETCNFKILKVCFLLSLTISVFIDCKV